ncbi:Zinc finger protein SNAI2 [Anabarilius grahami]|uniref:Zinc finger protein SNAI2 n=1 Tax=Anabarilius grahami TaxID=495550 RepID=A0A3N0YQM6_ANAGA|nr:Zinc finger protein SNAI2 [Anabarilius grahami]
MPRSFLVKKYFSNKKPNYSELESQTGECAFVCVCERPFSCPHCNRAFADRSNLRAHLQTHSEVKKYQCGTCSRTFSRMSLLHKHTLSGCCPSA